MERTLKLTLEKIKNPGSLGANPKRDRSSIRAYPILPTTQEEAEEAGTDRAEKWVNSNNINRSATQGRSNEEDANSKPPNYDRSLGLQYRAAQVNSQMQYNSQFSQGMYQPMFPMNTAWASSDPSIYQMQFMGTSNVPSREESENEKKERMKHILMKRKIPENLCNYYLETPEHWNFEDTTKEGHRRALRQP